MNKENIIEYMDHIKVYNKEISEYINEEKGVKYIVPTPHLLARIEYMELKEEELKSKQFQLQVDKDVEFNTKITKRLRPKYEITKIEADKFTLTDSEVKVYEVWNVTNGLGIYKSFNNKEDAIKLYDEINKPIKELVC